MKRVLWICNIMLPAIAKQLSLPYSNREGWLTGIFHRLALEKEDKKIELGICFPVAAWEKSFSPEMANPLIVEGASCYAFLEDLTHPEVYDARLEERFADIIADFKPDMIHVFGTEFPHGLAAVRAFGKPKKTLVGIQGLCSEIAKVYQAGLPDAVYHTVTFRDWLKKDSLKQQQEKFAKRGEMEQEIIRLTGHVTGRTRFDKEGTKRIHPNVCYHHMNETMRSSFYEGSWESDKCEIHSIFLGQGDYPLKGFHFMLEAMAVLLKQYPDAKLYVSGNSIIGNSSLKDKLKLSAYGKYLLALIKRHELEEKVIMLGRLTEEEIRQQFLKSSVFVCASVLENSPNMVGEAMLLGVPTVASCAGGIPDMLTDGREGILVPAGDAQALADAIAAIWSTKMHENGLTLAQTFSEAAKQRAKVVYDGTANYQRLLEIYEDIGACQ